MTFSLDQVSSTFQGLFKLRERIKDTCFQHGKNVREFTLNNPKVLKLAAVKATSKAFRF